MKSINNVKSEFTRPNRLAKNIVFVHGSASCGKPLLAPILSSLDRVEVERIKAIIDNVSIGCFFGHMTKDLSINLLCSETDKFVYNSFLSRNMNFRFSDYSSVFKTQRPLTYLKRLFTEEVPTALKIIQSRQHSKKYSIA